MLKATSLSCFCVVVIDYVKFLEHLIAFTPNRLEGWKLQTKKIALPVAWSFLFFKGGLGEPRFKRVGFPSLVNAALNRFTFFLGETVTFRLLSAVSTYTKTIWSLEATTKLLPRFVIGNCFRVWFLNRALWRCGKPPGGCLLNHVLQSTGNLRLSNHTNAHIILLEFCL